MTPFRGAAERAPRRRRRRRRPRRSVGTGTGGISAERCLDPRPNQARRRGGIAMNWVERTIGVGDAGGRDRVSPGRPWRGNSRMSVRSIATMDSATMMPDTRCGLGAGEGALGSLEDIRSDRPCLQTKANWRGRSPPARRSAPLEPLAGDRIDDRSGATRRRPRGRAGAEWRRSWSRSGAVPPMTTIFMPCLPLNPAAPDPRVHAIERVERRKTHSPRILFRKFLGTCRAPRSNRPIARTTQRRAYLSIAAQSKGGTSPGR